MTEENPPPPPMEESIDPMAELKECQDKYLRLLAEMENTRKRILKEKQEMMRFAIDNVIAEFLSPLDTFENALSCQSQMSEETQKWASGFQMILNQFQNVLASHGVAPFVSEGMTFDPHLHEAVETQEVSDKSEGTILKEFVRGYKSSGRVIRPARVKVSKIKKMENTNAEQ